MLYTIMQKHIKSNTTDDVGSIFNGIDYKNNDVDCRADVVGYTTYPVKNFIPNSNLYDLNNRFFQQNTDICNKQI